MYGWISEVEKSTVLRKLKYFLSEWWLIIVIGLAEYIGGYFLAVSIIHFLKDIFKK